MLEAGFDFARNGLLMLCRTDEAMAGERRAAGLARELGMPADVLDAKQTAGTSSRASAGRAGFRLFSA